MVCTSVGSNTRAVAEHTWGLILAYTKRPPPTYGVNATYRLVPAEMSSAPGWNEVCKTNQFRLLKSRAKARFGELGKRLAAGAGINLSKRN